MQDRNVIHWATLMTFLLTIPVMTLAQQSNDLLPEGDGKELVSASCVGCHSLQTSVSRGRSKEDWENTVNDMVTRGAQILTVDAETIIDYLAGNFPVGYRPPPEQRILVFVDRQGDVKPLRAPVRAYNRPRLSPDGQQVAVEISSGKEDIWIYDIPTDEMRRLTFDGSNRSATWSADGRYVLFGSDRHQQVPQADRNFRVDHEAYRKRADGSGEAERLTFGELNHGPQRYTPDGKTLSFYEIHPETGRDIWMLPLEGDRKPWLFLKTPHLEGGIAFSADGKWMAHSARETGGGFEIVVRAFPESTPMYQITPDGGVEVIWTSAGKEILYRQEDKRMVVEVTTSPTLKFGVPRVLFEGKFVRSPGSRANWDASADGQRFLLMMKVD